MTLLKKHFLSSIVMLLSLFALGNCTAYAEGLLWDQTLDFQTAPENYSYEGHAIRLLDKCIYNTGYSDVAYVTSEMAEEGYISTEWEGDFCITNINAQTNESITDMQIYFADAGDYDITLYSTWLKDDEAGNAYSITKTMEIRRCPAIDTCVFEGEARAFQRQKLSFRIAQNPYYPILLDSLSVTIKDSSGNIVPYCRDLEIDAEGSEQFINVSLEFVTKNSEEENFTYTVYAKDERNHVLDVTKEFTVKKDLAPVASLKIPLRIYRDENKIASANAVFNGVKNDDPVNISWTLPGDALDAYYYDDNKKVSFNLNKPGNYQISITLTDIWQDTLDEFTSEDTRKSSSYTVNFKVDNKAPYLDEDNTFKTFDLLLINNTGSDQEELKEAMLEYNVNLNIVEVEIDKDEPEGELSYLGQISITEYKKVDRTIDYESAQLLDDEHYYRLVVASDVTNIADAFYVYQYDLNDLTAGPVSTQIPSDAFPSMTVNSVVTLSGDLQEKNLYIRVDDETLIMNKKTCSFYPKLSKAIGRTNILCDDTVYSLCDDGFYSIDLKTGTCTLINDYNSLNIVECACRLIYGKAYFCAEKDGGIYQCIFDLNEKTFTANKLFESSGINYLLGISPTGNMYFESIDASVSTVRSYTRNCDVLYDPLTVQRQSIFTSDYASSNCCYPILDRFGEINYIYTCYNTANFKNSTKFYIKHLYSQSSTTLKNESKRPDMTRPILGLQLGDGSVLAGLGTDYYNRSGLNTGALIGMNSDGSSMTPGITLTFTEEFQCRKGEYIALSSTKNGTSTVSFYKFTEGYDAKSQRISLESLSSTSTYKDMTDNPSIDALIENNNIIKPGDSNVTIYREVGDTVNLSDFGFSKDNYTDDEGDYPLKENTTISFPFVCTAKGRYAFYFSVTDTTGTSFDKESTKQIGIIYVDSEEDDYEDEIEIEMPEESSGIKTYILHRRY